MNTSKVKGYTLIELMIVVAVVGILASVAYPAYKSQVEQTRRSTAQADLLELSSFMERWYTENFTYQTAGGGAPALPFTTSPKSSASAFYNLQLTATSATGYTLSATPINGQVSDTLCAILTLNNLGVQTASGSGGAANCW